VRLFGEHLGGGGGNGSWDALAADSTTWTSGASSLRIIHSASLAYGIQL